jgi:PPOX class probable F420-dependent enzyme
VIEPAWDVRERLEASLVIWLTTVSSEGQAQTSPVWYVWQDGRLLIYSLAASPRVRNLRVNPRVALNLDGDGEGGDIVTLEGVATLDDAGPPSTAEPAYQAKYLPLITSNGWSPESFAHDYPQRILVTPTRLRTY